MKIEREREREGGRTRERGPSTFALSIHKLIAGSKTQSSLFGLFTQKNLNPESHSLSLLLFLLQESPELLLQRTIRNAAKKFAFVHFDMIYVYRLSFAKVYFERKAFRLGLFHTYRYVGILVGT